MPSYEYRRSAKVFLLDSLKRTVLPSIITGGIAIVGMITCVAIYTDQHANIDIEKSHLKDWEADLNKRQALIDEAEHKEALRQKLRAMSDKELHALGR